MSTTPKSPKLGWEVKASRSKPENTYYFCKSSGKTQNEEPTVVCESNPATAAAPAAAATAATAATANNKKQKQVNVTVQTPAGPKSFTVIAKGGKQRKTRKNKNRNNKNKNKNKQSRSRRG